MDTATLKAQFAELFGAATFPIHVIRSPGRVNLIGEHTDYNDGFVLPMAIEPQFLLAARQRRDMNVRLAPPQVPGQFAEFSLTEKITRGEPKWSNYSRGVAHFLLEAG